MSKGVHDKAMKIARKRLNNQIGLVFDRNMFVMLGGAPITSDEMDMSLIRSEWYMDRYRKWYLRMAEKYGTGQGGLLNYADKFNPENES